MNTSHGNWTFTVFGGYLMFQTVELDLVTPILKSRSRSTHQKSLPQSIHDKTVQFLHLV